MRRAVRATRQAISPRLAIRILVNMASGAAGSRWIAGRGLRRTSRRPARRSRGACATPWESARSLSATSTATTASAATGCANASHSSVPTASSSPKDAVQFENGSGDVLMTARLPALARWLPAASVPPRIAAASIDADDESPNTPAASAAPAGMRTKVCTMSHSESTPGILSAKNSTKHMKPDAASTNGCDQHAEARRQVDPAQVADARRR